VTLLERRSGLSARREEVVSPAGRRFKYRELSEVDADWGATGVAYN